MNITQNLRAWGNGTGVRIPKKVREAAHIEVGQALEVSLRGRSIVLTPLPEKPTVTLESMLRGVTPTEVGSETDWGNEVGAEYYE
jgi:antitoxin component of MazEF toxin-antitoxin module